MHNGELSTAASLPTVTAMEGIRWRATKICSTR